MFLSQDWFGYAGSLWFHTNFRIIYSSYMKNAIELLIWIALNMYIALDGMEILTVSVLPIQEHETSFHLFVLSSISSISVSYFSIHRSFTFLVKFHNILFFLVQL